MDHSTRGQTELRFGTSGLRGLVREMTDREVYVNVRGWLEYLRGIGELGPGEPVALAEDLRAVDPSSGASSSPRISSAVAKAVRDCGFRPLHFGLIPTPALAYFAGLRREATGKEPMPSVMVTGSHIPADRNGVKFYRKGGEVLKAEEAPILEAVTRVRAALPALFGAEGMFLEPVERGPFLPEARAAYVRRYLDAFEGLAPLAGTRVVLYEHSAVGRDLLAEILRSLGAEVIRVDRSEAFVPVDTEDVTAEDERRFGEYARRHAPDAIVSTDGDGDRPLVVDEKGRFHRGDVVGLVTAEFLGASFAAVPISTSDALDLRVAAQGSMTLRKTRIGSPYVIAAMDEAVSSGEAGVVGWEANGGFLTASEFALNRTLLSPLPTRDAVLPILAVLLSARRAGLPVSGLFARLPQRATRSGLLDDFPVERSRRILERLTPRCSPSVELDFAGACAEPREERALLERYFPPEFGFGRVRRVNYLDGIRISFEGGDVAHLRPSGNAPQLRIYAVSDTDARAEAIVRLALAEDGIFRRMERELG